MGEAGNEAPSRRSVIRTLAAGGAGVAVGAGGGVAAEAGGGVTVKTTAPTSAPSVPTAGSWRPAGGHVNVCYAVNTGQRLVALTFDDGPMPNWTPMVHDVLDQEKVRATFFLIGQRVVRNARLIHGRMDRHEAANHTWAHADLSRLDHQNAYEEIHRSHTAIARITGKEPHLLRPPFGHLGGTTLSAASTLGYHLVIWSIKMLEATYQKHPPGLVDYIVDNSQPGSIILAHDTGHADRLVALRNLVPMIRGLRAKGFEFVTVSQLMATASPG